MSCLYLVFWFFVARFCSVQRMFKFLTGFTNICDVSVSAFDLTDTYPLCRLALSKSRNVVICF